MSASSTIERLKLELSKKQSTVDALMKGFLPAKFPILDGLAFDVLYKPAEALENLGGDWYNIFTLPDGRVAFSLGDVCSKGVGLLLKWGKQNKL